MTKHHPPQKNAREFAFPYQMTPIDEWVEIRSNFWQKRAEKSVCIIETIPFAVAVGDIPELSGHTYIQLIGGKWVGQTEAFTDVERDMIRFHCLMTGDPPYAVAGRYLDLIAPYRASGIEIVQELIHIREKLKHNPYQDQSGRFPRPRFLPRDVG